MILRRPYAFFIKHFRLIHLIMFGLFLNNIIKANNILNFFKDYITYNGNIEVVSTNYINYYIFISAILIIVASIIIYYLMKYKNKPKIFYIYTIILSIISSIIFIYLYRNIKVLETIPVSGREIRLFRDIARINFWSLTIFSLPVLVRGLGFDIKKFNFSRDLKELNLSEEDKEEVELTSQIDANSLKRVGRRTFRELKYYYQDNTLIINIIFAIIGIILLIYPFNKYVINRDLKEGQILSTDNFNLRVNSSFISNRNRISPNNSYIIVKISVLGKINKSFLDMNKITLITNNNKYIPSEKYYNYFSDIGVGYHKEILDTKNYHDYILIFNVDNSEKNYHLKYLNSKKLIRINPNNLE